jgi:hypothetical protein
MVKIGGINFKGGKTEGLTVIEAGILWEFLMLRYDNVDMTQHMQNFIHDPDFKYLVSKGLQGTLEKQVEKIEKELNDLKIQLPMRPPKSVQTDVGSELFEDRFIYKQLYTNIQAAFNIHSRAIFAMIMNDRLRDMFIGFLKEEVDSYTNMVKYGKAKGWLNPSPIHKPI